MGNFGILEILLILFIIILLFGGKKIPDLARGLGQGIRSFKKALHGDESEDQKK